MPHEETAAGRTNSADDVSTEPIPIDVKALFSGGVGALAEKMGITFFELTPERSVATMPVEGNTQPFGVVHGGAYVVLAESLGSFAANIFAGEGRVAMGIEVNASHTGSASSGIVTGVCTAIKLGRTLVVHEIAISDEAGRRLSTVRITNFIKDL